MYLPIFTKNALTCIDLCTGLSARLIPRYKSYQWEIKSTHNLINSLIIWIKVYINEFVINGIRKNFVPFWIDSDVDIESDPYTTDCSDQTNATNPHAYTQLTIINGELSAWKCIEKSQGSWILKKILIQTFAKY